MSRNHMGEIRVKLMLTAIAAASLLVAPASIAAPCKDPKTGKFIKCPPKSITAPKRCRDAKGHFAKCGTPGSKPA
jgi:hypothetical protein